jgi:hypothetical protein
MKQSRMLKSVLSSLLGKCKRSLPPSVCWGGVTVVSSHVLFFFFEHLVFHFLCSAKRGNRKLKRTKSACRDMVKRYPAFFVCFLYFASLLLTSYINGAVIDFIFQIMKMQGDLRAKAAEEAKKVFDQSVALESPDE